MFVVSGIPSLTDLACYKTLLAVSRSWVCRISWTVVIVVVLTIGGNEPVFWDARCRSFP